MTEHTRCTFKCKSAGDSPIPWIAFEPLDNLTILEKGFLCFEFKEGVTPEEIQEITRLLNEKVSYLSYTGDEPTSWV